MILRSIVFSTKKNKNTLNNERPRLLSDNACMSASTLTPRCANLCSPGAGTCWYWCAARCSSRVGLKEWQRTRVGNVLCVSEATQGRLLCLAKVNMWFPFGWLTRQPFPMVTSCPTSPHYQSGYNFLHSHHCCRSFHHQIHLHQIHGYLHGLQRCVLCG